MKYPNDKSYIGHMLEAFLLNQDTLDHQEHPFRNSLLPVLHPFANGFTAFVSLEEERRTHEQTLFQLTNPRITATDEVKLNVLSSSPPASHPPLDTVTPTANCHDKESVPPFTQSTLKDSWTIIPNCLCAK